MTDVDVMVRILHEATELPQEFLASMLDWIPALELTPPEAEKLLADLRQEKAGIRRWLVEGYKR